LPTPALRADVDNAERFNGIVDDSITIQPLLTRDRDRPSSRCNAVYDQPGSGVYDR